MDRSSGNLVNEAVIKALQREKNGYLNVKTLIMGFPREIKQILGFEKKVKARDFTAKDALDRVAPYLGEQVAVYPKGRMVYVSLDTKENMILRKLRLAKSFPTFKMLRKSVSPLLNDVFTQVLNGLLWSGKVKCTFKGDNPVMSFPDQVSHQPVEPDVSEKNIESHKMLFTDDPGDFQTALGAVGKGRRMVYIYQVRRHLNWSRQRFDNLIRNLRGEYRIQLHGGDPSVMTEDQVRDSFMDEKGILHISVSWQGK